MKTSNIIRDVANVIEDVIRVNDIASPNPSAIEQLVFQYNRVRPHCGYCAEKIRKIIALADDFYSARRHQFHSRGADGLFFDIRENIDAIRSWADEWERHGK
ncbi:hypothetical protein [Burkholderia cepacia]|uniref:hypothetical protein n=1 Tax=Burkholderia cepacia TaxID=292 RepID=UPI001E4A551A|nr:hypothetical protein [Burkholderia cepacia]